MLRLLYAPANIRAPTINFEKANSPHEFHALGQYYRSTCEFNNMWTNEIDENDSVARAQSKDQREIEVQSSRFVNRARLFADFSERTRFNDGNYLVLCSSGIHLIKQ